MLLKLTGDWGKFQGDADAVSTVKVREPKPAFSIEDATAIIVKGRGSHFDPDVVDAFLANIDAFRDVAGRFVDDGA